MAPAAYCSSAAQAHIAQSTQRRVRYVAALQPVSLCWTSRSGTASGQRGGSAAAESHCTLHGKSQHTGEQPHSHGAGRRHLRDADGRPAAAVLGVLAGGQHTQPARRRGQRLHRLPPPAAGPANRAVRADAVDYRPEVVALMTFAMVGLRFAQHLPHTDSKTSEHESCFSCRHTKWSTCAISGQPLSAPIAADWLGRLYNAEVRPCVHTLHRRLVSLLKTLAFNMLGPCALARLRMANDVV